MVSTRSPGADEGAEKSRFVRAIHLLVAIAALTWITVVVGYGGWALLTLSATLGGPDPETADGDPLRLRLLAWPDRNREFIRNNGRGDLPLEP